MNSTSPFKFVHGIVTNHRQMGYIWQLYLNLTSFLTKELGWFRIGWLRGIKPQDRGFEDRGGHWESGH
jgi:hypothetical protein